MTVNDQSDQVDPAIGAIAALDDPTRLALYRHVAGSGRAVSRDEAAAAVGIAHHAARFHLDRLLEAGLLEVEYKRPPGRGGPGAGRPTKLYRIARAEYAVSVPGRRYDLASEVLARAVAATMSSGVPVADALEAAAEEAGRSLASGPVGVSGAVEVMERHGFAPRREGGDYVLANCPFRALAEVEPEVICGMNLALVRGLLGATGGRPAAARLAPAEGRCCVRVEA